MSHWDGSFEYPQHMFWLRNKTNNFQIHTLIWGHIYPLHLIVCVLWSSQRHNQQWQCSGSVVECLTPDMCHCVVSLIKTHLSLLSTGSTQEGPSGHTWNIVDLDVKNRIKQTISSTADAQNMFPDNYDSTVKPILSGHSKTDKTKISMTNDSLMKVESIAECSPWSILQYFWPALCDNWSWKPIFGLFESGRFRQVLL